MDCPTRGVLSGEICLTPVGWDKPSICIVAADISRIKLLPNGYTKITFKRYSVGIHMQFVESPDEIKRLIAAL